MPTVCLRPLKSADEGMLLRWRNMPDVAGQMLNGARIDNQEHHQWFAAAAKSRTRRDWVIEFDHVPCGAWNLQAINENDKRARWGFYVAGITYRGKGIGTAAGAIALTFAFEALDLHRIDSEVLLTNEASVRLHERLGFKRDGLLREHVRRDSRYLDVLVFSILRLEWAEVKDGLLESLKQRDITLTPIGA